MTSSIQQMAISWWHNLRWLTKAVIGRLMRSKGKILFKRGHLKRMRNTRNIRKERNRASKISSS